MDCCTFFEKIKRIKERIDPLYFYETYLEGSKISSKANKGWRQAGLCPFHEDKQTGSFYIHQDTGAFKCFSCNAKGGDIITFLRQRDGISFMEALRVLEKERGIR